MKARAFVEPDWLRDGVKIAARIDDDHMVAAWGSPLVIGRREEAEQGIGLDDSAWLQLPTELARAIYEALADHFGHSGHDTRALRKDYDAERARVDVMIRALIDGPRT